MRFNVIPVIKLYHQTTSDETASGSNEHIKRTKEPQMNMGMLGMRGRQTQWASMIEAAYATKINQAALKGVSAFQGIRSTSSNRPSAVDNRAAMSEALFNAMCIPKSRVQTERNHAALAALMAPPKNQTTSEKNLAKLAAALNK